jgi:hypothetical protein
MSSCGRSPCAPPCWRRSASATSPTAGGRRAARWPTCGRCTSIRACRCSSSSTSATSSPTWGNPRGTPDRGHHHRTEHHYRSTSSATTRERDPTPNETPPRLICLNHLTGSLSGVRPDLGWPPTSLKLLRDLLVPIRYLFRCVSRRFTASRKSRDRSRDEIAVRPPQAARSTLLPGAARSRHPPVSRSVGAGSSTNSVSAVANVEEAIGEDGRGSRPHRRGPERTSAPLVCGDGIQLIVSDEEETVSGHDPRRLSAALLPPQLPARGREARIWLRGARNTTPLGEMMGGQ